MRILVCVLCDRERQFWVNPELVLNLLAMAQDARHEVGVHMVSRWPVEHARNACVVAAREAGVDWLLMVDNDQSFRDNPLDALKGVPDDASVLCLPYMRVEDGGGPRLTIWGKYEPWDDSFAEIDTGDAGAMFVHRVVWDAIKGPWFEQEYDDTELHQVTLAEGHHFCKAVREEGGRIFAHRRISSRHHWTVELGEVSDWIGPNKIATLSL